ncbi:MAG: pseudaminic acid synthase [Clostridium beijerinckii]|jgi:pseudaminic acid synthase|uniref:pseudaminic acid synthase n=1 Tax=Clostridium beijerinckii TaxID=1520 RepID=UPI0014945F96|nr:pseudaminic acid synthase [Clostridium beijerinckii]MCI1477713.1 pseudaminic acid synthase [Clostridium beijerinckii]MCI1577971.1 pseudaminic acid synthase [Clostridium beijerinckii]MCI1583693.1 pseudaminic acid synthase [Clostridium beijerinckii]MCI1620618.1 pseudaminic acid synthase [Clostridium beijerinckii]NOW87854.1 pseudaminic acid synthase [Clostridium beijerinckii]
MNKHFKINNVKIGEGQKSFIIAEMSANHNHDYEKAVEIIKKAAWAGADAIKIQTYTPDTITIDCDNEYFQIKQGTIWDGTTLHKLYQEAYTPWNWQPKLKKVAEEEGLVFFSSPFDYTAVDFLEEMDVPAYKIASFELNDIPFIEYIAAKGKPVIMSTGIARMGDIQDAVDACRRMGNENIALLKCTSAYPSPLEDINLKTIPNMKEIFNVVVGLSDHTMGNAVSVGGAAVGASIIEKHMTLRRSDGGADSKFSMEPEEFKEMVDNIRMVEKALGKVTYDLTEKQRNSREHSRSLFVVENVKQGEIFTEKNVRSIRPGFGLETKYITDILGKRASVNIEKGTPMSWNLIK